MPESDNKLDLSKNNTTRIVLNTETIHDHPQSQHSIQKVSEEILSKLADADCYSEHELIGEGGMGSVEQVVDTHCNRVIALKTLHKECSSAEAYLRFAEEVQITSQLEHPNIIPIYDIGVDSEDRIFYTMKLIKGKNLKEILREIKNNDSETIDKFPLSRLLQIFQIVCDAMAYACSRNIIHRDLKPENIMIGEYGEIYLVDWGLAKRIDQKNSFESDSIRSFAPEKIIDPSKTQNIIRKLQNVDSIRDNIDINLSMHKTIVGTPHYMAPERFTGQADEVSEIYALGGILYNILTLNQTLDSNDIDEIIDKIIDGDIKEPASYNKKLYHIPHSKVPKALSAIAMKALHPDREFRYQRIKELKNEISLWQEGFVTNAEEASLTHTLWLSIKRHKTESCVVLGAAIVLIFIYNSYITGLREQQTLFDIAKNNALNKRQVINLKSKELDKNTSLIQDKINELKSLSSQFAESSYNSLKNHDYKKALNEIETAIKLDSRDKFIKDKAFLLILNNQFSQAVRTFRELFKHDEKYLVYKEIYDFCSTMQSTKKVEPRHLIKLRTLSIKSKRDIDAAIYNKKLLDISNNLVSVILESFKGTEFNDVKRHHLTVDQNGFLTINLENKEIMNIGLLRGLPFKKINLSNNPISDLDALEGMPLKDLIINDTLVQDLRPLTNLPLNLFHAKNTPISNLEPIQHLPLRELNLTSTKIKDLTYLPVSKLKRLSIENTQVKLLKPLREAHSLRSLDISNTPVKTLAPIKRLNIKEFYCSNSEIHSLNYLPTKSLITLIANKTKIKSLELLIDAPLKHLDIEETKVSSLAPIKKSYLESLYISRTGITDLEPIRNMPIKTLRAHHTSITDLSPIRHAPVSSIRVSHTKLNPCSFSNDNIRLLELTNCGLTSPPDLSGVHITTLILDENNFKDFNGLETADIDSLSINKCRFESYDALTSLSFSSISLSECNLQDLQIFEYCKASKINLSINPIKDVSELINQPVIDLNLSRTKVTNIEALRGKLIQSLKLVDTKVDDISPLNGMPISFLDISNTSIENLSTISFLKKLKTFIMRNTKITNLWPLINKPIEEFNFEGSDKIKNFEPISKLYRLKSIGVSNSFKDYPLLKKLNSLQEISKPGIQNYIPKNSFYSEFINE
ncbi:MAG: serine/threonine protein kinase [Lentisphaeraceae bacterium]|nr:serine/threonine protein kinase [Lentisphaeraceae bacterium]